MNKNTTINNVTYVNRTVQGAVTAVPQRGAGWTFFATHTCFDRHDAAFSVSNLQEQNNLSR